jgi:hypothetical protein
MRNRARLESSRDCGLVARYEGCLAHKVPGRISCAAARSASYVASTSLRHRRFGQRRGTRSEVGSHWAGCAQRPRPFGLFTTNVRCGPTAPGKTRGHLPDGVLVHVSDEEGLVQIRMKPCDARYVGMPWYTKTRTGIASHPIRAREPARQSGATDQLAVRTYHCGCASYGPSASNHRTIDVHADNVCCMPRALMLHAVCHVSHATRHCTLCGHVGRVYRVPSKYTLTSRLTMSPSARGRQSGILPRRARTVYAMTCAIPRATLTMSPPGGTPPCRPGATSSAALRVRNLRCSVLEEGVPWALSEECGRARHGEWLQ